jgi:Na+/proline symporter
MFDFVASADVAAALGKEPITFAYVCVLSITALCGIIVQPHIMGVCGAGKTEYEGRFGFTFGNFLKRFCTVAWTFTGLACIAWYLGTSSPLLKTDDPNDKALYASLQQKASGDLQGLTDDEKIVLDTEDKKFADELFGRAAYNLLPRVAPGLIGLLMASLLAAVMSTSDAQMVVSSGLFTENIYKRHLVRGRSERHYLWIGRFSGLGIVAAALILQATFTDVIHAMTVIIKTPAAIGISMWFGIFWRRWNTRAVWVSTLAAAAAWFYVSRYGTVIYDSYPALRGLFRESSDGIVMYDMWQSISRATGSILYVTANARSGERSCDRTVSGAGIQHHPGTGHYLCRFSVSSADETWSGRLCPRLDSGLRHCRHDKSTEPGAVTRRCHPVVSA